jgi:hypothetical protein
MLCISKRYELKGLTLSISATIMACRMYLLEILMQVNAIIIANLFPMLNMVEVEQYI